MVVGRRRIRGGVSEPVESPSLKQRAAQGPLHNYRQEVNHTQDDKLKTNTRVARSGGFTLN